MSHWIDRVLDSRIQDSAARLRFEAGSPNPTEIAEYLRALPEQVGIGVVMGITPELRNAVITRCARLVSIDSSSESIKKYGSWIEPSLSHREEIICGDWLDLPRLVDRKIGFVVGDGMFGNIVPLSNYRLLLSVIYERLTDKGVFVTRQCLMPEAGRWNRDSLLRRFRGKRMNEAEFGLCMRIAGYREIAYESDTCLLDNGKVFAALQDDLEAGRISVVERDIVSRYYFTGFNTIPGRAIWEAQLKDAGFRFHACELSGKDWYSWYPIYYCSK